MTAKKVKKAPPKAKAEKVVIEKPSDIKAGMTLKVHQKISDVNAKGETKERIQVFEGLVLETHGGNSQSATFRIRKVSGGIGVEKIFPFFLPTIAKIEPVKQAQVRRANVGYLRTYKKKLKEKKIG